jgi:hypothetical protein
MKKHVSRGDPELARVGVRYADEAGPTVSWMTRDVFYVNSGHGCLVHFKG